jgi:hypothetical protein
VMINFSIWIRESEKRAVSEPEKYPDRINKPTSRTISVISKLTV